MFKVNNKIKFRNVLRSNIHITAGKTFQICDKHNFTRGLIFEVSNDEDNDDTIYDYYNKSILQLASVMKQQFVSALSSDPGNDYIFFKVNQCVIDPDTDVSSWNREPDIEVYYYEHLLMGMLNFSNAGLKIKEDTLVSKVPGNEVNESVDKIKNRLFSSKRTYESALEKGSKEYFLIMDMSVLNVTLDQYKTNLTNIKKIPSFIDPYNLIHNACGQMIQRVLGLKVDPKISPQTAFRRSVIQILSDDELRMSFMEALHKSRLNLTADELGRQHKYNLNMSEFKNKFSN